MKLPKNLLEKIMSRFDSLVVEGQRILADAEEIPERTRQIDWEGTEHVVHRACKKLDWPRFVEWRAKSATLLSHVLPKDSVHCKGVEGFPRLDPVSDGLQWGISMLKAAKDDLGQGFFDSLSGQIEAELASDYMGQAEGLLREGQSGKYDHVPAAVLAGAVLEKALRTLCGQQVPPIPTVNAKGEPKTLSPMIEDLKKADVFNETKAKQLRAWADIRNHAAHGRFDQFRRTDVEQMISGINNFLADYLK